MLQVFIRALFAFYRRLARDYGIEQTQCGAVTFVQRFGSAANLHVHFHILAENSEVAGLAGVLAQRIPARRSVLLPCARKSSLPATAAQTTSRFYSLIQYP